MRLISRYIRILSDHEILPYFADDYAIYLMTKCNVRISAIDNTIKYELFDRKIGFRETELYSMCDRGTYDIKIYKNHFHITISEDDLILKIDIRVTLDIISELCG